MVHLSILQSGMMPLLRKEATMQPERSVNTVEYNVHTDQRVAPSDGIN